MKPEAQKIAIATACGTMQWGYACVPHKIVHCDVPDYLNDLNAMYRAEETLNSNQWETWHRIVGNWATDRAHLTAAQRAEAFLRTLGLWEETP